MSRERTWGRLTRAPLDVLRQSRIARRLKEPLGTLAWLLGRRKRIAPAARLFHLDGPLLPTSAVAGKYLTLPWVAGHGDALFQMVDPNGELLVPLPLFRGTDLKSRRAINRFVVERPEAYRQILLRALAPLAPHVRGMVFTLDWTPPMRQVVYACRELGISTTLIPHESVFAERARYYVDTLTPADVPVCDAVLCWGELQRDIFVERGYPRPDCVLVGSPKLERVTRFQPALSRAAFAERFRFDEARPICLFAMQPLDAHRNAKRARQAQCDAITDLLAYCEAQRVQLLVRPPPSGHSLLTPALRLRLASSPWCAVDGGARHKVGPDEAIWHAQVVVSIHSTMLLEAALMGRSAISARYLPFEGLWEHAGIVSAHSRVELHEALAVALREVKGLSAEGRAWVERAFSPGRFDGGSVARIRAFLADPPAQRRAAHASSALLDKLFAERFEPVPCVAAYYRAPTPAMANVETMLGFRRLLTAPGPAEAQVCDAFVKWGITPTPDKVRLDRWARELNRPQVIIEDGFLRSKELGLGGEAGLSIIVDTKTAYYDATRPSRLEERLNSRCELSDAQRERALACMESIRKGRVSKYNHAPDTRKRYAAQPSILLVDQRRGDQSLVSGLANIRSFARMLEDAFEEFPEHHVLVKLHPDATRGGKESCLCEETLARYRNERRLVVIAEQVNPYALFDQVEQVFVATSGMGMEALIAGLKVRCYGVPFYSGWGLTDDRVHLARRTRKRDLAEVFHFAYIESSRYMHPVARRAGEIEDVIAYLAQAPLDT